jgi:hypothetical protein
VEAEADEISRAPSRTVSNPLSQSDYYRLVRGLRVDSRRIELRDGTLTEWVLEARNDGGAGRNRTPYDIENKAKSFRINRSSR